MLIDATEEKVSNNAGFRNFQRSRRNIRPVSKSCLTDHYVTLRCQRSQLFNKFRLAGGFESLMLAEPQRKTKVSRKPLLCSFSRGLPLLHQSSCIRPTRGLISCNSNTPELEQCVAGAYPALVPHRSSSQIRVRERLQDCRQ